jgi:predicted AAA+ superfamily ATPase
MLARRIRRVVEARLVDYPAVALVGPRQCGKTTLATAFHGRYFDLEQDADRLRLDLEWPQLVAGRSLVVLDEAQSCPEVFVRLRGAIDEDRRRAGRFLLLGSVSPSLMMRVSESLAGRLSVVELAPLSWNELPSAAARNRLWFCGGFPDGGVLAPRRYPRWQQDYLALLVQRDLPTWGLAAKPRQTERFLHMLAALHGATWNASQVGQSLGVSYHTVNSYLDYLEGAFIIRRLAPFHANIKKRLVKSPKVYWRDSGLLHAILGARDVKSLFNQPWIGASWEGYVIEQILEVLAQCDQVAKPYFLRTSDQLEIDLLLELGGKLWAFEVKLTTNPGPRDLERLDRVADLVGANKRVLVSRIGEPTEGKNRLSCNLPWLIERLEQEFVP